MPLQWIDRFSVFCRWTRRFDTAGCAPRCIPSAPTISGQVPVAGSTVSELTQLTVSFNEGVAGVNAADLLVNNVTRSQGARCQG